MKSGDPTPLSPEGRAALAFGPTAEEIMRYLRTIIPAGTHYGVFILAPENMVAVTTDRRVVAPAVAAWVIDVLGEAPSVGGA